jgi:hypothetical protein
MPLPQTGQQTVGAKTEAARSSARQDSGEALPHMHRASLRQPDLFR